MVIQKKKALNFGMCAMVNTCQKWFIFIPPFGYFWTPHWPSYRNDGHLPHGHPARRGADPHRQRADNQQSSRRSECLAGAGLWKKHEKTHGPGHHSPPFPSAYGMSESSLIKIGLVMSDCVAIVFPSNNQSIGVNSPGLVSTSLPACHALKLLHIPIFRCTNASKSAKIINGLLEVPQISAQNQGLRPLVEQDFRRDVLRSPTQGVRSMPRPGSGSQGGRFLRSDLRVSSFKHIHIFQHILSYNDIYIYHVYIYNIVINNHI